MKKFILFLFVISMLLVTVSYAKDCCRVLTNSDVTMEISAEDGYEFVGEYSFCTLNSCSSVYFNVYLKGKTYYVEDNRKYYRLMPTKVKDFDYNYYYSRQGKKYYVHL